MFERPTYSLIPHLHVIQNIDMINMIKLYTDSNYSLSIMATGALIRLFQIPMYWLIKVR